MVPDDLPGLVQTHAEDLGAERAVLYVADLDQRLLVGLSAPDSPVDDIVIDGTLAGRSFASMTILESKTAGCATSLWIPVVDGAERVGVLHMTTGGDPPAAEAVESFASLVAELVMSKNAYGDYFACARRGEPLTVASELLWQLLPPLTFACDDVVIAAGLTPTARLGGDAFDYGVGHAAAHVAIFDALGHDLEAGLLATAAVAAFRNGRRSRMALDQTTDHIGATVAAHFDPWKFVTGVVAVLETASGRFSWSNAGHPAPLLIRSGRVVKVLDGGGGQPFGVGPAGRVMVEELEPADQVLLYTDGITEARGADGEQFGPERLAELLSQRSHDHPPPEVIRRLLHSVEAHSDGPMRDDATVVLLEWRGPGRDEM